MHGRVAGALILPLINSYLENAFSKTPGLIDIYEEWEVERAFEHKTAHW